MDKVQKNQLHSPTDSGNRVSKNVQNIRQTHKTLSRMP